MSKELRIAVVSANEDITFHLQLRLQSKGYQVLLLPCASGLIGVFYSDPPDILLVDISSANSGCSDIISSIRSDSFFSAIPIIAIVDNFIAESSIEPNHLIDDMITLPINYTELFCRINLALSRIKRVFDNNPLTRLPGNTSIQRAIEESLKKELAVCYIDIDSFKPYNDVYGFAHGDEVIRMLSRIMFNAVRDYGGGFCGHIGGDDFVCITSLESCEAVSQTIIRHFDQIVQDLFDEDVKKNGYYMAENREGVVQKTDILSVSIAVVPMNSEKLTHSGKVAEIAAELKKKAKMKHGSSYIIDRRR